MAGADDRTADVIGSLIHLFGWTHKHDAESPDGGLSVDFIPLQPFGRWRSVVRHEPYIHCAGVLTAQVIETQALATDALHLFLGLKLAPSHD